MEHNEQFERIGMVARWRPVHRGHAPVLRALCSCAEAAKIGIGSANRYNARNPFTVEETIDMIRCVLADHDNYTLVPIDDLDDGPRWRCMILDLFGKLDAFVTANPYVASLLKDDYHLLPPVALIKPEDRIPINGRMVRRAMARGDGWREMVPDKVVQYIEINKLDERFRREFGLETLAMDTILDTGA